MSRMTIENIGRLQDINPFEKTQQRQEAVIQDLPASLQNNETTKHQGFGEMLNQSIEKVNELQLQADHAAKEAIAGRNKNIHETMLMMEKADMSFRLMMQVRNKVIEAYREIMKIQV